LKNDLNKKKFKKFIKYIWIYGFSDWILWFLEIKRLEAKNDVLLPWTKIEILFRILFFFINDLNLFYYLRAGVNFRDIVIHIVEFFSIIINYLHISININGRNFRLIINGAVSFKKIVIKFIIKIFIPKSIIIFKKILIFSFIKLFVTTEIINHLIALHLLLFIFM
jgi:hypothetical protein